jgi:hypothetical protein
MRRFGKQIAAATAALTAAIALTALAAAPAQANTPILSFSVLPTEGQAGGHPDIEVLFRVKNRLLQESKSSCACEDAKDATVHLPPGFIGNPHATPQCEIGDFSADTCPIDSQVGIVHISSNGIDFDAPVYNLVPPPDQAGLLAFKIFLFDTPQFTVLSARTGSDYGLDATATSIVHGEYPLETFQQLLWGVPADPSHDRLRLDRHQVPGEAPSYLGTLCDENGNVSTADPHSIVKPCYTNFQEPQPQPSNSPRVPFLQAPTTCRDGLISSIEVVSYDGGSDHAETGWPSESGCGQLGFNPSLYAQPTTTRTDTASGIDVDLQVPQEQSPGLPSPTELRGATVTLPDGFSINPNAADGKSSCLDSEASFGTLLAARCPEISKVGSLEIDSSALPGPLPGFVYLGRPLPGNRYRIFLVADGFATHVKIPGTVTPDPQTGRLTITFDNLPQTPLTAFNMHFFGSERGLLATPDQCGTFAVTSTFTPWDEALSPQTSSQFFTLDSGPGGAPCPGAVRPFNPRFRAASAGNTGGAHSPFALVVDREDGDQNLTGLTVKTPPGFAATIRGIPYCPDLALAAAADAAYGGVEELASPKCPAESQIGTASAAVGAGTHPLHVPGKVYLAGPYQGAPLSIAVVTPAVSGPYDLGNVVVRVAVHVDPTNAQITAVSDRLPQILQGIPLRLRSVQIDLDRPSFALNPTDCDPFSVDGTIAGNQDGVARRSAFYEAANCRELAFAPKLAMRLTGSTKRRAHPGLTATLTAPGGGEANLARVSVALPASEILDNAHIKTVCTRVQFAANGCPANSVIGSAMLETPILGQPLTGPVVLRSSSHSLPDLVVALKGPPSQPIEIDLDGRIDTSKGGGLRTTFEGVPDAALSSFVLRLNGGRTGLLQNTKPLCAEALIATVKITGQNGKTANQNPKLATNCAGQARHKRHHGRLKGGRR